MEETQSFTAEVGKLLHLMVNNIYSNKDTCIRELLSNAVDACDKLAYVCQFDSSLIRPEPKVEIELDRVNNLIRVSDNGIGMSRSELVACLGSIASSGTKEFLEKLETYSKSGLIGSFGLGFYSAFMIANKVEVRTCKAGESKSHVWSSSGIDSYTISELSTGRSGTEVTLYLKTGETDYLSKHYIESLVKRYANYLLVPIFLKDPEGSTQINAAQAIWRLNKSLISHQQYVEFYRSIANASDLPWAILHNVNEGSGGFINLLFIPSKKPLGFSSEERRRVVKLHVRGVFIGDDNIELIPHYLGFLRGLVEANSMPLNVSRETVQKSSLLSKVRSVIVARALNELEKELRSNFDRYKEFWANFGSMLKEGLCEDPSNGEKILGLCLFFSLLKKELVTLEIYLEAAKQKLIYYVTGESIHDLSPTAEGFLAKGIDVLFMPDVVDSFWLNVVGEYKGSKFASVSSALPASPASDQAKPLLEYFKACLGDLVTEVRVSTRLVDSATCLVGDGMDSRLERFLLSHGHIQEACKRALEVNLSHPLVSFIRLKLEEGKSDFKDLVMLLFEEASLIEGVTPPDKVAFCKRVNNIIKFALGI